MGAHPKRSKDSAAEKIYWVKATGPHWTLCREDDPDYALGVFESEERAVQAAQYLARHVSGGRVRVIQPGGIWETKYRHSL